MPVNFNSPKYEYLIILWAMSISNTDSNNVSAKEQTYFLLTNEEIEILKPFSCAVFCIYVVLKSFRNNDKKNPKYGKAWCSITTLENKSGKSRKTIVNSLSILEKNSIITKEIRSGSSTIYSFNYSKISTSNNQLVENIHQPLKNNPEIEQKASINNPLVNDKGSVKSPPTIVNNPPDRCKISTSTSVKSTPNYYDITINKNTKNINKKDIISDTKQTEEKEVVTKDKPYRRIKDYQESEYRLKHKLYVDGSAGIIDYWFDKQYQTNPDYRPNFSAGKDGKTASDLFKLVQQDTDKARLIIDTAFERKVFPWDQNPNSAVTMATIYSSYNNIIESLKKHSSVVKSTNEDREKEMQKNIARNVARAKEKEKLHGN